MFMQEFRNSRTWPCGDQLPSAIPISITVLFTAKKLCIVRHTSRENADEPQSSRNWMLCSKQSKEALLQADVCTSQQKTPARDTAG